MPVLTGHCDRADGRKRRLDERCSNPDAIHVAQVRNSPCRKNRDRPRFSRRPPCRGHFRASQCAAQELERRPGAILSPVRFRAPLLLCLAAACSYVWDESTLEANIVRPGNFKAGSGVIESVGVLPGAGSGRDPNLYRIFLRMDAGGFQAIDIDNSRFLAGEAVELTNDGRVVRVTGTTLNRALGRN